MMTREQIDALYDNEFARPYTEEALAELCKDRVLKTHCEILLGHNFQLIFLIRAWHNFLSGNGPRPEQNLSSALRPGNNPENASRANILGLIDAFVSHPGDLAPRYPIVVYASSSTMSLVSVLDEFHHTAHIEDIHHYALEFLEFFRRPTLPADRETLKHDMVEAYSRFTDACTEHAKAVSLYIDNRLRGIPSPEEFLQEIKVSAEHISERQETNTNRILRAIRNERQRPLDGRSPRERAAVDAAALLYVRRTHLELKNVSKRQCCKVIWTRQKLKNIFSTFDQFDHIVRYDLDNFYDINALIYRAKTEVGEKV